MDTTELIITALVILLVLGFNVALIRAARRRGSFNREIEMYRRVAQKAQNPWQKEAQDLAELSQLVNKLRDLKEDNQGDPPP